MKKYLALLFVCIMLLSLAACGDTQEPTESSEPVSAEPAQVSVPDAEEPDSFEVKEYGYSVSDGYLFYSVALYNPTDKAIQYPSFRVTAKDANGGILGSYEQTCMVLYPKQDFVYSGLGFEISGEPAEVTVDALEPSDYNVMDVSKLEHPDYIPMEVANASIKQSSYATTITGEIVNNNDYGFDMVAVTAVARDENGKMLGGDTTYVNSVSASSNTPFSFDMSNFGGATYDLYANIW